MPTTAEKTATPSKETWASWFPDSEPRHTVEELLELVKEMGFDLDLSTLRFWQREGIVPYPNRRKIGTGTYAVYPSVALVFIQRIREMQEAGIPLRDIKPLLRGMAARWNDPDPAGILPLITQAAQQQSERTGVPVTSVLVTFTDAIGVHESYTFTFENAKDPELVER